MHSEHAPKPDRREDSRNSLQISAQRWLTAEARREGFAAVLLADGSGELVAASATDLEVELFAAVAPLPADDRERMLGEEHELVCKTIAILGDDYLLCGVRDGGGGELRSTGDGLVRILAA